MRKSIRTIGTIVIMGILLVCAYWLGTTKTETITTFQTVTEIREVVPDGFINTNTKEFYNNFVDMRQVKYFESSNDGLQLYFIDGSGYWWEY